MKQLLSKNILIKRTFIFFEFLIRNSIQTFFLVKKMETKNFYFPKHVISKCLICNANDKKTTSSNKNYMLSSYRVRNRRKN